MNTTLWRLHCSRSWCHGGLSLRPRPQKPPNSPRKAQLHLMTAGTAQTHKAVIHHGRQEHSDPQHHCCKQTATQKATAEEEGLHDTE